MPTSSITKQFVISGEEQIKSFLDAWEASEKDPPIGKTTAKHITDPDEIRALIRSLEVKYANK